METEFKNDDLRQLYTDLGFTGGFSVAIVKAYRKRMQLIVNANDERDIRKIKSNHYEKLKGNRDHQHSVRLNDKMRLIFEIKPNTPKNIIVVGSIENYH